MSAERPIWIRLFNGFVNPVVSRILRSPAHRVLSGHLALLEIEPASGNAPYEIPVAYHADSADLLHIAVGAPGVKHWWRNFRSPRPLKLWLQGRECAAMATAIEDQGAVAVLIYLDAMPGPGAGE